MNPWIQTATGKAFYILEPTPKDLDIRDIAWALGHLCRFNGHTHRFYSVAEHCVHMSRFVSPEAALLALLHDAAEAYIGDIASPIKHLAPGLVEAEEAIMDAVLAKWCPDVTDEIAAEVKLADCWFCFYEAKSLLGPPPQPWGLRPDYTPNDTQAVPLPHRLGWSPDDAYDAFLRRFQELQGSALA